LKQLWKKDYFQTVVTIVLVLVVVFGLWFGSQLVLHTENPALAVASGSMCIPHGMYCDGWSHPFERTLHVGDLIIVQGASIDQIHAAPVNGDIIVYRRPNVGDTSYTLIVHRAVEKGKDRNGLPYVITKGDANPGSDAPVYAGDIVGKVIMRIPWVGHLALFMRNSSGIFLILAIILILVILEFILPIFTKGKAEPQKKSEEKRPESET
jgi:signal peptidase I